MNWLVVGLGNPGTEYDLTRHNVGFMVIDRIAERNQVQVKRTESRSLIGQFDFGGERFELVKPQTYMNLSGEAVKGLLVKDSRSIENLVVVVDDLALPFGTMRIRAKGSAGGHNGLKSLNACLGTQEYVRLRIGIKPDHEIGNTKKFVLERYGKSEREALPEILERAADAVECIVLDGIEKAMSRFNGS
ncbi:MAG: aminoacyl-tRNA hydrolase [Pyrinomonadaceae bacterium]